MNPTQIPTPHVIRNTDFRDVFPSLKTGKVPVVSGLWNESETIILCGRSNSGKSPLIRQLVFCLANGLDFLGMKIPTRRHIILFDYENPARWIYDDFQALETRFPDYNLEVPHDLEPYMYCGDKMDHYVACAINLHSATLQYRLDFIRARLQDWPESVIIFDPIDFIYSLDKNKSQEIIQFTAQVRSLLHDYPKASILETHNLRKRDTRASADSNLIYNPVGYMEEIAGSNDIGNRCDVRLGMERNPAKQDRYIFNGYQRSRGNLPHPFFLEAVRLENGTLAGFQHITHSIYGDLTPRELEIFDKLPETFHGGDWKKYCNSTHMFYRLLSKAEDIGLIERRKSKGYRKLAKWY